MNAVNPLPPASATGTEQRSQEPSMEEILASIRRIIADDQTVPGRARERDVPPFRSDARERPSDFAQPGRDDKAGVEMPVEKPPQELPAGPSPLDAVMAHGEISTPQYPSPHTPSPSRSSMMRSVAEALNLEQGARPTVETPKKPQVDPAPPVDEGASLYFDPPIEHEDRGPPAGSSVLFSANTGHSVSSAFNVLAATRLADNSDELLGLAREMIRPLLKTWLDDNLPSLVERLVRAEIERVARGGR